MGAGVTAGLMMGQGVAGAAGEDAAGRSNERISRFNAEINDLQAADAISRGESSVADLQRQTRGVMGTQRAGFAGQGVVVGDGASADVARSTEAISEADAQTLRTNAAMEAWGHRVSAADNRFRGRLARAEGRNRAIGTLLTTGSQYAAYGTEQGWWGRDKPKKKPAAGGEVGGRIGYTEGQFNAGFAGPGGY